MNKNSQFPLESAFLKLYLLKKYLAPCKFWLLLSKLCMLNGHVAKQQVFCVCHITLKVKGLLIQLLCNMASKSQTVFQMYNKTNMQQVQ